MIDGREGVTGDLGIKKPCRVVASGNITRSGLQTIDGVALAADERVLLAGQATAAENGIYVVSSGNWQRAKDCDGNDDLARGTLIFVTSGTTYAGSLWRVTTADPIIVDAT